jgi:transcriptional regulator with XRE-family HTH domain
MAAHSLNYRELAEKIARLEPAKHGPSQRALSNIVRRRIHAAPATIKRILAALDCPPEAATEYVCAIVLEELNYRRKDPDELVRNLDDLLRAVALLLESEPTARRSPLIRRLERSRPSH